MRHADTGAEMDGAGVCSVTCDGTLLFLHEAGANALVAAEEASALYGFHIGDPIISERFHRADMAYGKDVEVVSWSVCHPLHGVTPS